MPRLRPGAVGCAIVEILVELSERNLRPISGIALWSECYTEEKNMRMTRKDFLVKSAALIPSALAVPVPDQEARSFSIGLGFTFNVASYGAKGDGAAKDTRAIQSAIDAAGNAGGTVYFPAGKYVSGTLHLRSLVTLYLSPGSTLLASPDPDDFDAYEKLDYQTDSDSETTFFHSALLLGEGIHDLAIVGRGVIDGNRVKRGGPKPIALKNCRVIQIRDITLRNAPNYTISMLGCDYVDIDGVTIFNGFADGIDPDCSRYVRIANCYIESWDDCICPKTSFGLGKRRSTENITVSNCILTTASNAFKLGTESSGDFKNIAVTNCTVFSQPNKWKKWSPAGVAIESVDGANIDRVVVSNIAMEGVRAPIFIRLGNRGRAQKIPTPGTLRNISISNITATGATLASSITGIPDHPVKHVSISHVHITAAGGGLAKLLDIPENVAKYPDPDMFGELPAYGLFCRHTEDLTLCEVQLSTESHDERPALVADNVTGLELVGFQGQPPLGDRPVVYMKNVRRALISGARALNGTGPFLGLGGEKTERIHVLGSDFSEAKLAFVLNDDVGKNALIETANILPENESLVRPKGSGVSAG
jgi:polygalacturonase